MNNPTFCPSTPSLCSKILPFLSALIFTWCICCCASLQDPARRSANSILQQIFWWVDYFFQYLNTIHGSANTGVTAVTRHVLGSIAPAGPFLLSLLRCSGLCGVPWGSRSSGGSCRLHTTLPRPAHSCPSSVIAFCLSSCYRHLLWLPASLS